MVVSPNIELKVAQVCHLPRGRMKIEFGAPSSGLPDDSTLPAIIHALPPLEAGRFGTWSAALQ